MKRSIVLILMMIALLLAGCQSAPYRWVTSESGFPPKYMRTFESKSKTIRYCLVPGSEIGEYYFEGVARSKGMHSIGRISSGAFYLLLLTDGEVVHKERLSRQGNQQDKDIFLRKSFKYSGKFNQIGFSWLLRYYG